MVFVKEFTKYFEVCKHFDAEYCVHYIAQCTDCTKYGVKYTVLYIIVFNMVYKVLYSANYNVYCIVYNIVQCTETSKVTG